MKRKKRAPKIVAVVWLDAIANAGWTEHDEAPEAVEIHSVGFLVKKTRTSVTLATSVGRCDSEHNATITIPRGMIQRMTDIV